MLPSDTHSSSTKAMSVFNALTMCGRRVTGSGSVEMVRSFLCQSHEPVSESYVAEGAAWLASKGWARLDGAQVEMTLPPAPGPGFSWLCVRADRNETDLALMPRKVN